MSEPSPASIFKRSTKSKPRANRERATSPTSLDASSAPVSDDSAVVRTESPMAQVAKLKAKQKARLKPQTRLSFGVDEDENTTNDTFKVKKSALSRKMKLGVPPHTPSSVLPDTQAAISAGPTTSMYSKAYLSELKASTPSTPPVRTRYQPDDLSYDQDMDVSVNFDEEEFAQGAIYESTTSIPADSSIQAAKQKRDRLRALGTSSTDDASGEFISLSLTKRGPVAEQRGPHPDSRLAREEDEFGEGDDDMAEFTGAKDRIALGKKSRKAEAKKRKADMAEMIGDAEEEDEETKEWEMAQIRRGGNISDDRPENVKAVYKATPIPTQTALPTLAGAMSRLSASLLTLTTSHAEHTNSLDATAAEATSLEEREVELREMVTVAEAKRAWYAEMREWMESVATFMDEKFPELEKFEKEHASLLSERYEMIKTRRKEDDEDDLALFLPLPPPPPIIDDLGRFVPDANFAANAPHSAVRAARRASRLARFTATSTLPPTDQDLGYATDSALHPSDSEDYLAARSTLSNRVHNLLADVQSPEFRDPRLGLGRRFGKWREKWGDAYTGAWGGIGMIGAWEFWTRVEMVEWDPLEEKRSLDSFEWYSALYDYSRPARPSAASDKMDIDGDDEDTEPQLGPDGDLVNSMITTAVIPQLARLLSSGGFDPYSERHTRRLVDLAEQVEMCVDKTDTKFHTFIKAVIHPFREAIDSTHTLVVRALDPNNPPPSFEPQSLSARRRFLLRRLKLLSNLMMWRKFVGESFGLGALVGRIVVDIMEPIARNGGDEGGGKEVMLKVKAAIKDLAQESWARRL